MALENYYDTDFNMTLTPELNEPEKRELEYIYQQLMSRSAGNKKPDDKRGFGNHYVKFLRIARDSNDLDLMRCYIRCIPALTTRISNVRVTVRSLRRAGVKEVAPMIRSEHLYANRRFTHMMDRNRVSVKAEWFDDVHDLVTLRHQDLDRAIDLVLERGFMDAKSLKNILEDMESGAAALKSGTL